MPVTLSEPFSWQKPNPNLNDNLRMLDGLQANILKGHVRHFLTVLFLRFDDAAIGRTFLKKLATNAPVKSAHTHLQEVRDFKANKKNKGTAYVGVGISATGYAALGIPVAKRPGNGPFKAGMKAGEKILDDPHFSLWDKPYQGEVHAVVLVGNADAASRDAALAKVEKLIVSGIVELSREHGLSQHNSNGDGIEHFGYVDGRSQPLFLTEDIDNERLRSDGTANWDPAFAPNRAIVPDPGAPDPAHDFGSYFVFRKLEQNVRKFKDEEEALAKRLKLSGNDAERAGAMLVGRFEDGTPLAIQSDAGAHNPVQNDFNYDSDPHGGKCPHFAHIRKMNPRGTLSPGQDDTRERLHIMARRGQTYGIRADNLNDGETENKPSGGVGLLFMAFNAKIEEQFEFVQQSWANDPTFPPRVPGGSAVAPGTDPVIGQFIAKHHPGEVDPRKTLVDFSTEWGADFSDGDEHKKSLTVAQTVTMKGGEYFFMPSIPFLRALPP